MTSRINPTLFDKLVADLDMDGLRDESVEGGGVDRASLRLYSVPRLERFNEAALRATVLRELNWLLNTTCLGSGQDLSAVPEVATSVLNYGLGDLAGTLLSRPGIEARGREIREAVVRFEPRVARGSLEVEPVHGHGKANSVGFVIRGDIANAVRAMPVEFHTEVEIETGTVSFRRT